MPGQWVDIPPPDDWRKRRQPGFEPERFGLPPDYTGKLPIPPPSDPSQPDFSLSGATPIAMHEQGQGEWKDIPAPTKPTGPKQIQEYPWLKPTALPLGAPFKWDESGNPYPFANQPPNQTFMEGIKQSLTEGPLPELHMLPPEKYPGATRNDWIGSLSRASMYPVGAFDELYNKVARPFTSPTNLALLGASVAQPEMIPYALMGITAQQAFHTPEMINNYWESLKEKGITPETIGQTGELGMNLGMMFAGARGARHGFERYGGPGVKPLPRMPESRSIFETNEPTGWMAEPGKPIITDNWTAQEAPGAFQSITGKGGRAYPESAFLPKREVPPTPELPLNEPVRDVMQNYDAIRILEDQRQLEAGNELEARRLHIRDIPPEFEQARVEPSPFEPLAWGRGDITRPSPRQVMEMRDRFFPESAPPGPLLERRAFERPTEIPWDEQPLEQGPAVPQLPSIADTIAGRQSPIPDLFSKIPEKTVFLIRQNNPRLEEALEMARQQGYEFLGKTDKGDYRFGPPRTGGDVSFDVKQFPPGGSRSVNEMIADEFTRVTNRQFDNDLDILHNSIIDRLEGETNPARIHDNFETANNIYEASKTVNDPVFESRAKELFEVAKLKLRETEGLGLNPAFSDTIKLITDLRRRTTEARRKLEQTEHQQAIEESDARALENRRKFELIKGGKKDDPDIVMDVRDPNYYGNVWDTLTPEDIALVEKYSYMKPEDFGFDPFVIKQIANEIRQYLREGRSPSNELDYMLLHRRALIRSFGDDFIAATKALAELDSGQTGQVSAKTGKHGAVPGTDIDYANEVLKAWENDQYSPQTAQYLKAYIKYLQDMENKPDIVHDFPIGVKSFKNKNQMELTAAIERGGFFDIVRKQKVPGTNWTLLDAKGLWHPDEIAEVAGNFAIRKIIKVANELWSDFQTMSALIPDVAVEGITTHTGIVLDSGVRGLNIRNPKSAPGKYETALFTSPAGIISEYPTDPHGAAIMMVENMKHEFLHNLERKHGAVYEDAMQKIMAQIGYKRMDQYVTAIEKAITDPRSPYEYGADIKRILQLHSKVEGREGRIIASRRHEKAGGGPGGVSFDTEQTGKGILENYPIGREITLKRGVAQISDVKRLTELGFEYVRQTENGGLVFKRTAKRGVAPILEQEVAQHRPTPSAAAQQTASGGVPPRPPIPPGGTGRGPIGPVNPPPGSPGHTPLGPPTDVKKPSNWVEAWNFRRGLMASIDFSAVFRQGLGLIHKGEFWKSLGPMFKAWATEGGFDAVQQNIANRPLFKPRIGPRGKMLPSFAEEAGLKLTDLVQDLSKREENLISTWAESGAFLGNTPLKGIYRQTTGRWVRASNRAYVAFLNNLRASTFEHLIQKGKVFGADGTANLAMARNIANFVNTATGRGSLGKLEQSAVVLNSTLFAPRLIASRLQTFNPYYYYKLDPFTRLEALKSLAAITTTGVTIAGLAKLAGAEVSTDPASSDFMKAKIGNVRIDPWGGYQQYAVAFYRLASSRVASSTRPGRNYDLMNPRGPYDPTHLDVLTRFGRGKLHPEIGFAWSMLDGFKEMSGQPMNFTTPNPFENAMAQRFIPIILQDLYELAKEEPELLPFAGPAAALGMGVQSYSDPRNQR